MHSEQFPHKQPDGYTFNRELAETTLMLLRAQTPTLGRAGRALTVFVDAITGEAPDVATRARNLLPVELQITAGAIELDVNDGFFGQLEAEALKFNLQRYVEGYISASQLYIDPK